MPKPVSNVRRLDRVEPFTPLRPVTGRQVTVRLVLGPLLWLVALVVVAIVVRRTDAIELGVLVAVAALAVSIIVLSILRVGRDRERRRYADPR